MLNFTMFTGLLLGLVWPYSGLINIIGVLYSNRHHISYHFQVMTTYLLDLDRRVAYF